MFCSKCGNELSEGAKFCGKCGAQVKAKSPQANQAGYRPVMETNAGKQEKKTTVAVIDTVKKKMADYIDTWKNWKKLKDNEKYIWFGVHGGIVLAICCIVVVLTIFSGSRSQRKAGDMLVLEQENTDGGIEMEIKEEEIAWDENEDSSVNEYEELEEEKTYPELEVVNGTCEAGGSCFFGSYPISKEAGSENMEWIILEVTDNKILVLSKYLLPERMEFNNVLDLYTVARWDACSLRAWLNNFFYNDAFTEDQKSAIITTQVGGYDNRIGGDSNYTNDKVFCLSTEEAYSYINNYGSLTGTFYDTGIAEDWWLRTEAETDAQMLGRCAAFVNQDGRVKKSGDHNYTLLGVRPAMWIDLNMVSIVSR